MNKKAESKGIEAFGIIIAIIIFVVFFIVLWIYWPR